MPAQRIRPLRRTLAVAGITAALLTSAAGPTTAGVATRATTGRRADLATSAVITQWNSIAVRTIATEGLVPVPASPLYLSFTSIAMYDAVVSIRGGFEPYAVTGRPAGARSASIDAAVATAAYTVLTHDFPGSTANLDADYAAALAEVPDGRAKDRGVAVGRQAAHAIIDLRVGDGRNAAITLDPSDEPGAWRPTPPAMAPMLVPWLGFVEPLVLRSPTVIRVPGPDPLRSRKYARDFGEVKAMGAADSASRTPEQTQTALFWNDNSVAQYQTAMRRTAAQRRLGPVHTARMFALVNTATADALIACWREKYDDPFWRPVTAITLADADGNPATEADPTWTPLAPTPPYPEYPSGHACITGAVTRSLSDLFGARRIDLDVDSAVTGTSRHFDTAAQLNRETKNARIWLGFHFRTAMTDGNRLGQRTAAYVIGHEFRRSRR